MERSHSVSSGPAQQDDSWTCQRCGWVYPNAHPSAKHRRNHKKQCGKIKGFKLQSDLPKGGSSDEASSGDDSHTQKAIEAGSAASAVEHPNAPQSRDLLVTELNVPDKVKSNTPFPQDVSASLDVKPEATDHQDIISIDTVKTESPAPEPEPNVVSLDKTPKTSGEGKVITLVDRVEEPAHILPGLDTDEAKEFVTKDIKCEDPPIDLTTNTTISTVEEHSKPHPPQVDRVEAAVRDLPGLDSDQANSADNEGAKTEGFPPKHTESIASVEEPSKTLQDESKVTLTPSLDKVEMAAHESQGLDSDHAKVKSISKEQGLNRQGSSQGDDAWMCRRCGWVYPNPHPSAKHRKKHKKQCGKIKGFELHTEPHNGGSSDEVSSDEDVHVKKVHVPHQPPQLLQAQEQANETVATESLPSIADRPAISVEGEIITESASNGLQPKEFSAQVDAPDGELQDTPSVKDISTTDMIPSVVPELPQNVPSLDQQNLSAGDKKKDVVALDHVMKISGVSDEPDTTLTKESPKHLSMKEETHPIPAVVQENFESSEIQSNAVPSLPKSLDTHVEHGSTTKIAEEPAGISREWAPNVASIASVSDLKSSDASPPLYFEDKSASILKVDEPSAGVMDPKGVGLSDETLNASAGGGLNRSVILTEEIDVSEKPGLGGLDTASNLDALDDTVVKDPLRKEMGDTLTGGSDGQLEPENISNDLSSVTLPADKVPVENKSVTENLLPLDTPRKEMGDTLTRGLDDQLEPENISSDLSSVTLPADKVPVENKSVTENLLPLAALSTAGLANDANEEGRFLSVQNSVNQVQLVPKNELLEQIVEGGNDDAFLSTLEKTDETPPVTNVEHLLDNQTASVGVAEMDVPKEVTIPAVTTGEVTIPAVTTGEAISTSTGGSDGQLEPENISSDLSSRTLPADKVLVENKSVTENLLPLAALSTASSANDANEEGRFLSVQTSVNPVQRVPKNESLAQVVEGGGNDDAFLSTIDKTDETPPVTNMEHVLDNQTASVGVAEVDVPKEVTIPAVTTGEAISIQKGLDEFASKNVSSVSEDSGRAETGGDTICIAKDTGVADIAKENEVGRSAEGISFIKDGEQEKTEASDALEAMAKPEAKEETPFEAGGIGSSGSSYAETYSFTRSESGVTVGTSSHKLSDSLEIYEDAQDSLDTCSVGGSAEESESLDEPRQALDRLQEEPKHLGAAPLDEGVPGESVAVEQKPSVSNGSRLGEASFEEKAPTLPGTSYGGRNEMEDLKAPSPEAWQEPGPSNVKSEGKKISTTEVTEESKYGESHTALRSLMAKEVPDKADPIVETSTVAGDSKSLNRKDGSLASANGTKPKSKSFWRHCICCSAVH